MNRIVIGDSQNMAELDDKSVSLVVTSPPFHNSPFDYPGLFRDYAHFLQTMQNVGKEIKRVLQEGRVVAYVVDDVIADGERRPITADITRIFLNLGFRYRDRVTWVKPHGFCRISRRSGVLVQHPWPMYGYFDNLQETVLIFQKGRLDFKKIPREVRDSSRIDMKEWLGERWHVNMWSVTNVLPRRNALEKGIAAFPYALPYRLIKLYSYRNEVVLIHSLGAVRLSKLPLIWGGRELATK